MPLIRCSKTGKSQPIIGDKFRVGREIGDFIVDDRKCLSGEHFIIEKKPSGFVLRPLGIAAINGTKIDNPVLLNIGDRISIGHSLLVFEADIEQQQDQTRMGGVDQSRKFASDIQLPDGLSIVLGLSLIHI